jgi:hypothetical protein
VAYAPFVQKRALLAFSLPLAAIGTLAGHAAGYALVGTSHEDARVHGYLSFAPQFVAVCLACVALALLLRVGGRLRGRPAAWPFAIVPPLAFLGQELIERLVAGLPAHAVLEPPVYAGLAAQLPIALLGFFAARALLRVADEAVSTFASRPVIAPRTKLDSTPLALPALVSSRLAFDRLGRAPPHRTARSAAR